MPDVGMAQFQISRQHLVRLACERLWPAMGLNQLPNKSDCSSFVKMVAKEMGIELHGDANAIYGQIKQSPWSPFGYGDGAAHLAAVAATNGMLVVGAWKNPNQGGHGHVAIIVDTNHASPVAGLRTRARAYWGQIGPNGHEADGLGQTYALHSQSWGGAKRPDVFYAGCSIAA